MQVLFILFGVHNISNPFDTNVTLSILDTTFGDGGVKVHYCDSTGTVYAFTLLCNYSLRIYVNSVNVYLIKILNRCSLLIFSTATAFFTLRIVVSAYQRRKVCKYKKSYKIGVKIFLGVIGKNVQLRNNNSIVYF